MKNELDWGTIWNIYDRKIKQSWWNLPLARLKWEFIDQLPTSSSLFPICTQVFYSNVEIQKMR